MKPKKMSFRTKYKLCPHYGKRYKCRLCWPERYCEHDKLKHTCGSCNPKEPELISEWKMQRNDFEKEFKKNMTNKKCQF